MSAHVPRYKKVSQEIIEMIKAGKFKANEKLPTVKDLAKDFGVSLVTASRAINVLKEDGVITTKWGGGCYVRDWKERRLKSVVTLLVSREFVDIKSDPFIENYWDQIFSQIIIGIQKECAVKRIRNHNVILPAGVLFDEGKVDDFLKENLAGIEIDGGLCLWHVIKPKIARNIEKSLNCPVIFNDTALSVLDAHNTIQIDLYTNARQIMQHLVRKGHKRIACIAGSYAENKYYLQRMRAYEDVLRLNELEVDKKRVYFCEDTNEGIYRVSGKVLNDAKSGEFSAVYCFNDYRAMVLYEEALKKGFDVPGKLAIAGFDGTKNALDRGITTVQLPCGLLGKEAVSLLESIVCDIAQMPVHKRISSGVIEGKTT